MNSSSSSKNQPFIGKVSLVTGGSGAIGREVCLKLAQYGSSVIINCNSSYKNSNQLLKELSGPGKHIVIKSDISIQKEVSKMFKKIKNDYGRLDHLINNAGWTKKINSKDLNSLSETDIDRMVGVNIKGVFFCSINALQLMKKNKNDQNKNCKGNIINIVSNSIKTNSASNLFYIATKSAANSLTKSFAKEFGKYIRVNSIAPGLIKSRLTNVDYDAREKIVKKLTPGGDLCKPEDIGISVISIIKDLKYLTGQCIYLDGGRTI